MKNSSVVAKEGLDLTWAWASGRGGDRFLALHIYFLAMGNGDKRLTINN